MWAGRAKSFTAGFLTTCGLQAVGSPCMDKGEELPLHGSIANFPAEQAYWLEENGELIIRAVIKDEGIFARKLRLNREIRVNLKENAFIISDTIENTGDTEHLSISQSWDKGWRLHSTRRN